MNSPTPSQATSGRAVKASRPAALSRGPDLGRRYFVPSGGAVGDLTPPSPPPAGRRSPAALDEAVAAKAGELAGRPPLVTLAEAVRLIAGGS